MSKRRFSKLGWFAVGAVLGAAALYFLDPVSGRRRRARARDKGIHLRNLAQRAFRRKVTDLENRAQGLAHAIGLYGPVTTTITRTKEDDRNLGPTARDAAEKGNEYVH